MASKPGIARRPETTKVSPQVSAPVSAQERVNLEMFRAIEMLGRKLEKVEDARERMARRLIQIESSAAVDEKTGKLYLPVVAGNSLPATISAPAPKWQGAATLMSSALALLAIGLVLFREPAGPQFSPAQMAALDTLAQTHFAALDNRRWKPLDAETARDTQVADIDISRFTTRAEEPAAVQEQPAPVASPAPVTAHAETQMASAEERVPTVEELNAIEPAAGAPEAAEAVVAAAKPAPAVKPAVKAAPVEKKPAVQRTIEQLAAVKSKQDGKPLQRPQDDYAPIPLAAETPKASADDDSVEAMFDKHLATSAPSAAPPMVTGVEPDVSLPRKLASLENRAFAGIAEAQHDLATIYAAGRVVPQDYGRAAFWFSRAAEKGVSNADYNLGVMFQQGLGVRKDLVKALSWYEKAAQLGHPEAMYNLGIAYIEGIGAPRNIARGVLFFKQAANAGVAQAAYNLGVLYESSFVGPVDLAKAAEWYRVAATEGHAEAKLAVARLKSGGTLASAARQENDIEPAASPEGEGQGDETPADENVRIKQAEGKPDGFGIRSQGFGDNLVRDLQEALITRGELPPGITTGYMTVQTEDAIRAWQKSLGWEADGKPSRELLEKITGKN